MLLVIKTSEQYDCYLSLCEKLLEQPPTTQEGKDFLELLITLLDSYENRQYPIINPDPIDAIKFRMTEQGLKQKDLIDCFGSKSRVSEVLSRKRPLTVPMIRALTAKLKISVDILVGL